MPARAGALAIWGCESLAENVRRNLYLRRVPKIIRLANGQLVREAVVLRARDRSLKEVPSERLCLGDWVAQPYGQHSWPIELASLAVEVDPSYGSQKAVTLPDQMTPDLALLLGAFAAEGHCLERTWTVVITNAVDPVLELVLSLWRNVFGLEARLERRADRCPQVFASSKSVVQFLGALGCGRRASNKRIPAAVMQSPQHVVLAFLSGLALDAYTSTSRGSRWGICLDSPLLLDDIQLCLRRLGVVSNRIEKWNPQYEKYFGEVLVHGRQAQRLLALVPFLEPDKQQRALVLSERSYAQSPCDVVPIANGPELYTRIPSGRTGRNSCGRIRTPLSFLNDPRTVSVSRTTVERLAAMGVVLPADVKRVLDEGLHFSRVASITFS